MRARLTKIKGGRELRTATVEGDLAQLPVVGSQAILFSDALDIDHPIAARMVSTSMVMEARFLPDGEGVVIDTFSGSRYLIERIQDRGENMSSPKRRNLVALSDGELKLVHMAVLYQLELDPQGDGVSEGGPEQRALERGLSQLDEPVSLSDKEWDEFCNQITDGERRSYLSEFDTSKANANARMVAKLKEMFSKSK